MQSQSEIHCSVVDITYPSTAAAGASPPDGPCSPANLAAARLDQPCRCIRAITEEHDVLSCQLHLDLGAARTLPSSNARDRYWRESPASPSQSSVFGFSTLCFYFTFTGQLTIRMSFKWIDNRMKCMWTS